MAKTSNIHFHPAFLSSIERDDDPRPTLERPGTPAPEPSQNLLDQRIGEELLAVQRWIENVAYNLSSDPMLASRHATQLGALKRVAGSVADLASIVSAADKGAAVGRARQDELRARLERRAITTMFEARH